MIKYAKNRRSFILLESILAVGIIGLVSSLCLKTPAQSYQKNLNAFFSMELSRISFNDFSLIESNFKQNHPWDSLSYKKSRHGLKKTTIDLSSRSTREYQTYYEIKVAKEKTTESNQCYKLIDLVLIYQNVKNSKEEKFDYQILVTSSLNQG